MKGRLIVFEGIDSSGKKTQADMLIRKLRATGMEVKKMSFPTYQDSKLGFLVAEYLKGKYGDKERVPLELSSLFYTIDRYQFKEGMLKDLQEGKTIVLDRYFHANLGFQAAKVAEEKREELIRWMKAVESRLPQPDVVVLLNVVPDVSDRFFGRRRAKNPLMEKGEQDIHEKDKDYQERVRQVYLELAKKDGWIVIDCCEKRGGRWEMRSRDDIHKDIVEKVGKIIL